MALDLTPVKLRAEIQAAIDLRRDVTNKSASLIKQYAAGSRESWDGEDMNFENHCFEWNANIVPHLAFANPAVRVSDMGVQDDQTEAVQIALRAGIAQTRLNYDLAACALDVQFDFGCGIVLMEPTPGFLGGDGFTPMRVRFKRLSPRQVFRDSRAPELGKPRFEGHMFVMDKDDMAKETEYDDRGNLVLKYNRQALEALSANDGLQEIRQDLMQDGIFLPATDNQIIGFEVYVAGHNGTGVWVTLGFSAGGGAEFLRMVPEVEYRGPLDGCYCWFGTYTVPDQVYPLANLAVTRKQVEEINKHQWQAMRDAGTAKQIGVVNGAAPGIIGNIQDAKSGDILSLPGFNGVVNTMKFGGMMPETADYIQFRKEGLDRLSGLSEMQRGNITGATATEADQAAKFVDVRLHWAQQRFKEDTALMLGKWADLLYGRDSIAFPVTVESEDGGPARRMTFQGGGGPVDPNYPWRPNMTVEIEPYSQEYTNQTKMREEMIAFQQQVLGILKAQLAMPMLNGRAMIRDLGASMNMNRGADRYVNWQAAAQMIAQNVMNQQAAAEAQIAGGPGGPPARGPAPRGPVPRNRQLAGAQA